MLTLIGDVHGKVAEYRKIVSGCKYSVQLGDFSTNRKHFISMPNASRHKILFGNHDYYPALYTFKASLGDFGEYTLGGVRFFFVRGSISIDRKIRLMMEVDHETKTWFPEEELNSRQMDQCLTEYETAKPDIVLSHDCPIVAKDKLGGSSQILAYYGFPPDFACSTQKLLQAMWDIHQPSLWVFGHWHRSKTFKLGNTTFTCLNELETFNLEERQ